MIAAGLKRQTVLEGALAFWLISTFIVAVSARDIVLNFSYGLLSFVLLFLITCSDSKASRSATFTLCTLYGMATAIPLALAISAGSVSTIYYWLLGLNTLLAVKCLMRISLPHQATIARLLILVCFILVGFLASGDHAEIDSVSFLGGSSNLLSAALITVVCWHCFVRLRAGHREPILVPLGLLVFAMFLGGRSGILISFGILLTSALFRASRSKTSLFTACLILPVLAWFLLADLLPDLIAATRLRHGFHDDIRTEMIQEYIRGIGPMSLLIGGGVDPSGIIASYGGNPHNSLVRAHLMFGILPIALFMLILTISVVKLLCSPTRVSAYGSALGGLILLRAYYDSVTFWFELDFAIMTLLFSPILFMTKARKKRISRETCQSACGVAKNQSLDGFRTS